VLLLARGGDSLQGIKKGVLELADVLAVNKADGVHRLDAEQAAVELAGALHLLEPATVGWTPPVLTCSAIEGTGLGDVWQQIEAHRATLERTGQFEQRRADQQVRWMWQLVQDRLRADLESHEEVRQLVPSLVAALAAGSTTPASAAASILAAARS
jgi:LAO/AO transport system kinase